MAEVYRNQHVFMYCTDYCNSSQMNHEIDIQKNIPKTKQWHNEKIAAQINC